VTTDDGIDYTEVFACGWLYYDGDESDKYCIHPALCDTEVYYYPYYYNVYCLDNPDEAVQAKAVSLTLAWLMSIIALVYTAM